MRSVVPMYSRSGGGLSTSQHIISVCSYCSLRWYHHNSQREQKGRGVPHRNPTPSSSSSSSTRDRRSNTNTNTNNNNNSLLVLGLKMGNTGCISRVISDGVSGGEKEEGDREERLVVMPYMAPGDALLLKPNPSSSSSSNSMLLSTGTSSSADGGIPTVVIAPGTVQHQQVVRRSALLSSPATKLCPHRATCGLCPWHHLSPGGSSALKQKRAKDIFPPMVPTEGAAGGSSSGYSMVHTSAFPDQSSPHTATRQFTLHIASSDAAPPPAQSSHSNNKFSSSSSSSQQQHHQKSPRRFDDVHHHHNRLDGDGGEFSDVRYDLLDKELKQQRMTNSSQGGQGAKSNYYFGLHNALNEIVPTPSCLVAPLSVTSIANSIVGKLNAAKFAASALGANLLAVTVIEVPLTQQNMSPSSPTPSSFSSSSSSHTTAVRVVVLVKSMSAIFEGQGGEELEYMLSQGKLSVSERLLVDSILTATVTCSRVFVDLQETAKKTPSSSSLLSSSSRGSGGGNNNSSKAAGKVRHLYPTVGVRPRDSDVDVGSVVCEAPLVIVHPHTSHNNNMNGDRGVSQRDHQHDNHHNQLVEFEMPAALIGLGRGKGMHRFHHGMAATFSVAFTKVSDIITSLLLPPPPSQGQQQHYNSSSSSSFYEIVVLRGTGAPHTSIALSKAAEDYVVKQHHALLRNQQQEQRTDKGAAASHNATEVAGDESNLLPAVRGSVRPSTHFELNDYIRSLIRTISSSGGDGDDIGGGGGRMGSTSTSNGPIIIVVAAISATTEEASLHALWNSCGLSRNITNPIHKRNAPISGFVLICEDEDAAVILKKFMTNAAARGASAGRSDDAVFNSTVVDVDRRSASFSLVVSWKKEDVNE